VQALGEDGEVRVAAWQDDGIGVLDLDLLTRSNVSIRSNQMLLIGLTP
jgi:hypothetical protein